MPGFRRNCLDPVDIPRIIKFIRVKRFCPSATFAACLWLAIPSSASAGMTVVTLTDMAAARIDALSFFLALYLLIALLVKLLWNHLRGAFTFLPKLDYRRALGLVFVTGLMFYVVLTMISGARELLTPGAWEKQGVGYRLRGETVAPLDKDERRARLEVLKLALWNHAATHEGKVATGPFSGEIPEPLWRFPGGGYYGQVPGVQPGGGRDVLLYEPAAAGPRRFVLLADGSIEDQSEGDLKTRIDRIAKP
jgi:hypothetical protein